MEQIRTEEILEIVDKHCAAGGDTIAILHDLQNKYGFLPEQALRIVAEQLHRPLVDVYGVATFYRSFRLKPRGKHLISVCMGTACHVRGSPLVVQEFQRQLGIAAG
jgi:NADH:ubiquinone oxidoreductase subunit E